MTLYRRKSSPKWYGEYTDSSGKRVQKSTGTTIKRDSAASANTPDRVGIRTDLMRYTPLNHQETNDEP